MILSEFTGRPLLGFIGVLQGEREWKKGEGGRRTTHTKGVRGRIHVSLTGIGANLADMAVPFCVETIVLTNENLRE